jgi:hypothetical protein
MARLIEFHRQQTAYLDKKQKKALSHRAEPEPIHHASASDTMCKYMVECKAKSQKIGTERRRQIVVLGNTTCSCPFHKPQILHKSCSHVVVAYFRTRGWHWGRYVSRYLLTVKIRQPSHEFTFGVGITFVSYSLVLTPVV